MDAAPDHAALLRRHGLQVTAQRQAVLTAVSERPHGTAAEIGSHVRQAIGTTVSPQAALRRPVHAGRHRHRPPHPARRVARPLRGPGRRQPPPSHLPSLRRPDDRRGLRRRVRTPCLTASPEDAGYEDRRSRGHLLGEMPGVHRGRRRNRPTPRNSQPVRRNPVADSQTSSVSGEREPRDQAADSRWRPAPDQPGLVAEPA